MKPPSPAMEQELLALHVGTQKPVRLRWTEGRITDVSPVPDFGGSTWLAPPLFDLQINGYAGVDFQNDSVTVEHLLAATHQLRLAGCAGYLLTLITDRWPALITRLRRLRNLRAQSRELQEAILGWHVEGPFLSSEPGFCGAHNPSIMSDPSPEQIHELRNVTGADPVLLTIAPERKGAIEAIALAVSLGLRVSLGHTNASRDLLVEAQRAGATGFTHLGNGCPSLLDRRDNILWRVFDLSGFMVSLIPDGIHVSPELFRLAHRALPEDAIYYTTDAMAAAGSPPGRYRIGQLEVEVGEDQVVRLPGTSNFAGSALTPLAGVCRAANMLQRSWQSVWACCSLMPAKLMGWKEPLQAGTPATFNLVHVDDQNRIVRIETIVNGT